MNRKAADYYHPAVLFAYSISLVVLAMLFFHPVFILLGLCFAILQNLLLNPVKQLLRQFAWSLPICAAIALLNPLVSHGGKTLLFYFWGNPVTLEATYYGLCSGGMLLLVFLLFGIYNRLVTPDRFQYLFSKFAPAGAMLVTMTQRMIPLFTKRLGTIRTAQKTLQPEKNASSHRRFKRALPQFHEISILLSWSMEEGLETADSMKARGYGIARRSFFSIYHFKARDAVALVYILLCDVCCAAVYYTSVQFRFYPRTHMSGSFAGIVFSIAAYVALAAALPIAEARFTLLWSLNARHMGSAPKNLLKETAL